jgi:hypothetical protein
VLQGELRDVFGWKMLRMYLIVTRFRDVPVLAEEAAHVATSGPHTEDSGAWKKMIERLLFDGIDLESRRGAVTKAVEFAGLVDSDEAEASLAGIDVAMPGAEVAVDAVVRFRTPPKGLVERARFLKDLQVGHANDFLL